jgi:hypothetical protein
MEITIIGMFGIQMVSKIPFHEKIHFFLGQAPLISQFFYSAKYEYNKQVFLHLCSFHCSYCLVVIKKTILVKTSFKDCSRHFWSNCRYNYLIKEVVTLL